MIAHTLEEIDNNSARNLHCKLQLLAIKTRHFLRRPAEVLRADAKKGSSNPPQPYLSNGAKSDIKGA